MILSHVSFPLARILPLTTKTRRTVFQPITPAELRRLLRASDTQSREPVSQPIVTAEDYLCSGDFTTVIVRNVELSCLLLCLDAPYRSEVQRTQKVAQTCYRSLPHRVYLSPHT